ncbi:MAG TPA: hypothetical protein VGA40_01285, partial [Candidatus Acidoferrales bacterium]
MPDRIHTAGPVHLAAIDAGSNAIRIAIARAESPYLIRTLHTERFPVRLGHNVFTNRTLDKKAVARAIKALRRFAGLMAKHHVPLDKGHYRAVATSATREARNRRQFVRRIERKTDVKLEIIDGAEEARLVVGAVLDALGSRLSPRLVVDLGGGTLEVNLIRQGQVEFSRALPVGTVRLLENFHLEPSCGMTGDEHISVRNFVLSMLRSSFRRPPELSGELAVACGGNAEALAELAPGPPVRGIPTINVRLLRERLWDILGRDVRRRMKAFHVREDRADVMGVAAIVFLTLARWMNIRTFLVPGVGVREGVLREMVQKHFAEEITATEEKKARAVLAAVRWFAAKHQSHTRHDEQVRRLGVALFDQLAPVHHMGAAERRLVE